MGHPRSRGPRSRKQFCEAPAAAACPAVSAGRPVHTAKEAEFESGAVLKECASAFISDLMKNIAESDSDQELELDTTDGDISDDEESSSVKAEEPAPGRLAIMLTEGAETGELLEALRATKPAEAALDKASLLSSLVGGARDGTLLQALQQVSRAREAEEKKEQEGQFRAKVLDTMTQSLQSGDLDRALARIAQKRQVSQEQKELDELRGQARTMLQDAAASGALGASLHQIRDCRHSEEQHLKEEARRMLCGGLRTGKLSEVLQSRQQSAQESEELRGQVLNCLCAGARDGRLAEALARSAPRAVAEPRPGAGQPLQAQVMSTLLQGLSNGKLAAALAEVSSRVPARSSEDVPVKLESEPDVALADLHPEEEDPELDESDAPTDLDSDVLSSLLSSTRASEGTGGLGDGPEVVETDEEDLRSLAMHSLMESLLNGRLESTLCAFCEREAEPEAAGEDEDAESLRSEAFSVLLEGARSGRLGAALTEVRQEAAQAEAEKEEEEEEVMRESARATLIESLHDGRLEQALAGLRQERSVEELRHMAASSLAKSLRDGRLSAAVAEVQRRAEEQGPGDLRQKAFSCLADSLSNGSLEELLAKKKAQAAEASVEELRQTAMASLSEGLLSGRLDAVLARRRQACEEQEAAGGAGALRIKARTVLSEAANTGALDEVMERKQKAQASQNDLRSEARSALMQGVLSGQLFKALNSKESAQATPVDDHRGQEVQESAGHMEAVRQSMFGALLHGARSGALEKALQPAAPTASLGGLSSRASPDPVEDVQSLGTRSELGDEDLEDMASDYIGSAFRDAAALVARANVQVEPPAVPKIEAFPPESAEKQEAELPDPETPTTRKHHLYSSRSVPSLQLHKPAGLGNPLSGRFFLHSPPKEDLPTPLSMAPLGELKGVRRGKISTPNLRPSSPAGALRPRSKATIAMFRMDSDEESEGQPVRRSSFGNMFEAMGNVDFHCIGDSDTEGPPKAESKFGPLVVPPSPASTHAKPRAPAMSLDLGVEAPRSSPLFGSGRARSAGNAASVFKSSSMGSLPGLKPKATLLPSLEMKTPSATALTTMKHQQHKHHRHNWSGTASSLIF